jgi:hypothetical protein
VKLEAQWMKGGATYISTRNCLKSHSIVNSEYPTLERKLLTM